MPTPPDAESSDSDHMAFVQVGDGPDGVAVAEFDSESARRAPRNSASTSIVQKHRVFFSGPPPALPGDTGGKECVVVVSGIKWVATFRVEVSYVFSGWTILPFEKELCSMGRCEPSGFSPKSVLVCPQGETQWEFESALRWWSSQTR